MCAPQRLVRIAAAIALSLSTVAPAFTQPSQPSCRITVHVARFEDGAIAWNAATSAMKTWLGDARRRADGLCQTDKPEHADAVIVWQDFTIRTPYIGEAYSPGTIGAYLDAMNLGGAVSSGDYLLQVTSSSGLAVSPPAYRLEPGVLITLFVTRPPSPLALAVPASVTWRVGRWPWSKPDRDALIDALTHLRR